MPKAHSLPFSKSFGQGRHNVSRCERRIHRSETEPGKFVEGPAHVLVNWKIVDKWDNRICNCVDIVASIKYGCHSDVHGHPQPGTITFSPDQALCRCA